MEWPGTRRRFGRKVRWTCLVQAIGLKYRNRCWGSPPDVGEGEAKISYGVSQAYHALGDFTGEAFFHCFIASRPTVLNHRKN